jgi:integrase
VAPGYALAFNTWAADRTRHRALRQASSLGIYRSMWDAFVRWCVSNRLAITELTAAHLEHFIEERAQSSSLSDRHAWRWLMLLDAVLSTDLRPRPLLAFAAASPSASGLQAADPGGGIDPFGPRSMPAHNAAAEVLARRPDWRYANASHRDQDPEFLSASQARHLVKWLLDAGASASMRGAKAGSWQSLRNRCAAGLHLGAGLTPADLRALSTASVVLSGGRVPGLPWRVLVPAHGAVSSRVVPVANWSGRLLQQWLARRAEQLLPGELLFPGTRRGGAWSKVSHYEAMAATLLAAGVAAPRGGSYVLRHTFALRQLRRGTDAAEVARWLGVTDPGVMARYQGLAFDPDPPA